MNKRIKKKKYNKWETSKIYNMTLPFEEVPFIFDAFEASKETYFPKFAASRNVMRAVRSYCKKYVWFTGVCDNIDQMYRMMNEDIYKERKFVAEINEQRRMQREYNDSTYIAPMTNERIQTLMTQGNWCGDLEHPTTRSDMIQSHR